MHNDSIFELSEREFHELNADGFGSDDLDQIIESDSDSDESEIDDDVDGDMVDRDVVRITSETLNCQECYYKGPKYIRISASVMLCRACDNTENTSKHKGKFI